MGDRGGRVIVFQQESGSDDFEYLMEMEAHKRSMDYLTSNDIPEHVTAIEWVNPSQAQMPAFLVSNSNCVKLVRLAETRKYRTESIKKVVAKGGSLKIPKT